MANPRSGLASPAGSGIVPQDAGTKERRSPLENSLSWSGKRTSWVPREDDPSRQGPQLETRSTSSIASTSRSWKLLSPWQPPPPSRIRGAAGHFRCRLHRAQRASCACADVGGSVAVAVAELVGPGLCFKRFLLSFGVTALASRLRCPHAQRARDTPHLGWSP